MHHFDKLGEKTFRVEKELFLSRKAGEWVQGANYPLELYDMCARNAFAPSLKTVT